MVHNSLFTFVLSLCFTLGWIVQATDWEPISPEKRQELEHEFDKALMKSEAALAIKQKIWTCDMYGMRSKMQVKRGVKLYQWKNENDWKNSGAQVVSNYKTSDNSLSGETDRFEDQVRLTSKGQLISRLSLTRPERQVLAYSVCSAQP